MGGGYVLSIVEMEGEYRSLNKTDPQNFFELPTQTKSSVWILNLGFVNAQLRDDDCKIRVFKSAAWNLAHP